MACPGSGCYTEMILVGNGHVRREALGSWLWMLTQNHKTVHYVIRWVNTKGEGTVVGNSVCDDRWPIH